jgi:HEAT repeat protein
MGAFLLVHRFAAKVYVSRSEKTPNEISAFHLVNLSLHGDSSSKGAQEAIMRGLALGDDLAVLLKSLKHSDAEVRRSAAVALESFGAEAAAAVPVLVQALDDPDGSTQVAAARTLGQMGAAALPGLLEALRKPEKFVRREAIWALVRMGSAAKKAVPALAEALRDSDPRVRLGAAQALGAIGPDASAAIPSLIECLKDSNLIFCRLAAQALTRLGPEALPALQQASQSPDPFVRREALWALGHLGQSTLDLATSGASVDPSSDTPNRFAGVREKEADLKATIRIPVRPKNIGRTTRVNLA